MNAIRLVALAVLASIAPMQPAAGQSSESPSVNYDTSIQPPQAEQRDHSYTRHGITVSDPYAWLRDPSYPVIDDVEVLDYLKAENTYFEAQMSRHKPFVDELFTEMRARLKEDDSSVPQKDGEWIYWSEYEAGGEYPKYFRRPVAGGDVQLYLDVPKLAEGHEYFNINDISISESGRLLAYSTDTSGAERYSVHIIDLATGERLSDTIEDTNTSLIWTANDTMLVYGRANENWRVDSIRVHRLGTDSSADVEIYHEDQLGFTAGPALSANREWMVIAAGDNETSEVLLLPASNPLAEPVLIRPREKGIEYAVDVHEDTLLIWTNDTHVNFRLASAPISDPSNWTTVIEGSDEFYLTGFELFRDFYVTEGRLTGLDQVQIRQYDDPAKVTPIEFPEATYTAGLGNNPEWAVEKLRLSYQSPISPATVYDYDLATGERETLKVQEVPSGFDPSLYTVERLHVRARDGAMVPVSIVYRKDRDAMNEGPAGPLHLYGYGAYGSAVDPGFSTTRFSLVDRGMAYAIAHIRGGDDLGRNWYLAGKLVERTNTFNDFVDVARGLIDQGYTSAGKISASGGSAGGELMGAVINQAPELFGAIVADVPFVDVLTTMLDETLPLTPGEWPEWGNPVESKAAFTLMLSYSPYDQVVAQAYPPMLVTAGLNDPRVTYWEPAKWVAKLREYKTDDNILMLKTNMGAGHAGKTGRFEGLKEIAEAYGFILWQLGLHE